MKFPAMILMVLFCCSACKKDKVEDPVSDNSITWQLDNYSKGQSISYNSNFVQKEEAVVVLGRMNQTYHIKNVQFLFGGKDETQTITLKIYRDKENGDMLPGQLLFESDYNLTATEDALQMIDLSSNGGSVRVAIRFQHNGLPSIGYDQNLDNENENLMNLDGNWIISKSWNITGDWIIRAVVE